MFFEFKIIIKEVNKIEEKLDKMAKEIELLQRDNNSLRSNEERLRGELLNLEKQRDNYREKYQETKSKNNILNTKLGEVILCLIIYNLIKIFSSFEKFTTQFLD